MVRSTLWLGFFTIILLAWWMMYMMAMQMDLSKMVRSAKRGLRSGQRGVGVPAALGALGAVALFAVLVGPVLLGLPPLVPMAPANVLPAIGAYAAAVAIWLLAVFMVTAATVGLRRRAA